MNIQEAIAKYATQRPSPDSQNTYRSVLAQFLLWLAAHTALSAISPIESLSVQHAFEFVEASKSFDLALHSRDYYRATVYRFFRFLSRERLTTVDTADLERLREKIKDMRSHAKALPRLPSDEDLHKLLEAARAEPIPAAPESERRRAQLRQLRNVAILEAFRTSGMRLGALIRLSRKNLIYASRAAHVLTKGNQEVTVLFSTGAWEALQAYLQARGDGAQTAHFLGDLPVFARHDRGAGDEIKPLTRSGLEKLFDELVRRADLGYALTPHWLRHSFAMHLYEKTRDIETVSHALHHAKLETTRTYAEASAEMVREAHAATFE